MYTQLSTKSPNQIGANLIQVLELARLSNDYARFRVLLERAEYLLINGNNRAACNVFYQMWADPHILPALLLTQCFGARKLVIPAWYNNKDILDLVHIPKSNGGTRPIIIPSLDVRICMGAVNLMLQASHPSWDARTTGFRPGHGTHTAINLLASNTRDVLQTNNGAVLLLFDLRKAFNSVCLSHLFDTLQLHCLPKDMKHLIWQWHNAPLKHNNSNLPVVEGLAQGFCYSPTLFAWYLDVLLVKRTRFIAYADNFAGVFHSEQEAADALAHVNSLLQGTGLSINPDSIELYTCNLNSAPHTISWLGQGLILPSTEVKLGVYEVKQPDILPKVFTLQDWKLMFKRSNWVHRVYQQEWRLHKATKARALLTESLNY